MDNKKLAIIILAIVAFILAILLVWVMILNNTLEEKIKSQNTVTPTATVTATATVEAKTDEELIKEALAEKYGQTIENLTVTIDKISQNAANGGVLISGEQGGGWFVAVKESESWKIIADGNGAIDCAIMDQYSVPNTVVGECTNFDTGEVVTR